jgi:hypothetical protein
MFHGPNTENIRGPEGKTATVKACAEADPYPLQLLQDNNMIQPEPSAAAQVKLELQQ